MLVLVSRDNENNRWKRNAKKKQRQKRKRGDRSYTLSYTFTVIEKSVSERATVNE